MEDGVFDKKEDGVFDNKVCPRISHFILSNPHFALVYPGRDIVVH